MMSMDDVNDVARIHVGSDLKLIHIFLVISIQQCPALGV